MAHLRISAPLLRTSMLKVRVLLLIATRKSGNLQEAPKTKQTELTILDLQQPPVSWLLTVDNLVTIVTKLISKIPTVSQDQDQDKTGKILELR